MDSENFKYPCADCKRQNKDVCNWRDCMKYIDWLSEKWQETIKTLKRESID